MKLSKKIISVLVATVMLCLMMPSVLSSASGITAEDFFTYEMQACGLCDRLVVVSIGH